MNYRENFQFSDGARGKTDTGMKSVYYTENETGNGMMSLYSVSDGITVLYNDFHLYDCSTIGVSKAYPGVVELNHCREGRFECEYENSFCYIGEGDFVATSRETVNAASCFPLSHYHGISVVLDFNIISQNDFLFRDFGIDIPLLKRKLCSRGKKIVLRKNTSIEHIFSELYTVHDSARVGYLKLKVLELLMFLTVSGILEGGEEQKLYSSIQVRRIKAVKEFVCKNPDSYYTLAQLAGKFGMSLTSLKQDFRTVYGKPPASFIREFRMQKAACLLRTTDDTVLSVALRVGYDNPSKFASAFRSVMSCNPSEYRRITI